MGRFAATTVATATPAALRSRWPKTLRSFLAALEERPLLRTRKPPPTARYCRAAPALARRQRRFAPVVTSASLRSARGSLTTSITGVRCRRPYRRRSEGRSGAARSRGTRPAFGRRQRARRWALLQNRALQAEEELLARDAAARSSPRVPPRATMRWQGTTIGIGLVPQGRCRPPDRAGVAGVLGELAVGAHVAVADPAQALEAAALELAADEASRRAGRSRGASPRSTRRARGGRRRAAPAPRSPAGERRSAISSSTSSSRSRGKATRTRPRGVRATRRRPRACRGSA